MYCLNIYYYYFITLGLRKRISCNSITQYVDLLTAWRKKKESHNRKSLIFIFTHQLCQTVLQYLALQIQTKADSSPGIGMPEPFPGINRLSSLRILCRLIYNQGHRRARTHDEKFDTAPDVQMHCFEETYLLPPARCSTPSVSPNVVSFVMSLNPVERRRLRRAELNCAVKTVKECQ